MKTIRDFTVEESFDREQLLNEALEIVRYADVPLGPDAQVREINERKAQAAKLLQKLDEEQASFSPKLDVRRLTKKDFAERDIEPSRDLKAKMRDNYFYHVGIPVTLFPRSGWAFTRLESWVCFCPDETDFHRCPIVYEIFPEDVWMEILGFQDHLKLGLDENFSFRAEVEKLEGQWEQLSGAAQAKLAVQAGGGARLVVGPFSYHIRRAKVQGRGRLDVESFWRLDSKEFVDEEDVLLSVVLMVPKDRGQTVNAVGELKAYHDFQIWSADVLKDWIRHFRPVLKAFFGVGAVVTAKMEWEDLTR